MSNEWWLELGPGRPDRIEVSLATEEAGEWVIRVSDNGAGQTMSANGAGFGLIGMRERVEACGGVLAFGRGADRCAVRLAFTSATR